MYALFIIGAYILHTLMPPAFAGGSFYAARLGGFAGERSRPCRFDRLIISVALCVRQRPEGGSVFNLCELRSIFLFVFQGLTAMVHPLRMQNSIFAFLFFFKS